jgi:hypothetical protein
VPSGQSVSPVCCSTAQIMRIRRAITQVSYGWVRAAAGLAVSMAWETPLVRLCGAVFTVALGFKPGISGHKGRGGFTVLHTTPRSLIPGIMENLAP